MKKNRGFTLIELLATIIILAGVALVAFPILLNTIKNSEGKIDEATKKIVYNATKLYIEDNLNDYPLKEGKTYCITFDDLIKSGHLEKDLVDVNEDDSSIKTVKITNTDTYNYEIVNSGECTPTKICRPATAEGDDAVTIGNVPAGNYAYGDEYICDPGDGVERRFFVLEDGDTTSLTKGNGGLHNETENIGTTSNNEVSLIMDRNIGSGLYVSWCSSNDFNTCNADGAVTYLASNTIGWVVDVTLPTYAQIKAANGGVFPYLIEGAQFAEWINVNLNSSGPFGYWTSTYNSTGTVDAWAVGWNGGTPEYAGEGGYCSVRPVITISKNDL